MITNHGWGKYITRKQKDIILKFSMERFKTDQVNLKCFDQSIPELTVYWDGNKMGIGRSLFTFNVETNEITRVLNSLNPLSNK